MQQRLDLEPPRNATEGSSRHSDIRQKDTTSQYVSDDILRSKCAICVPCSTGDPDLQEIVNSWPELPRHIKAAITTLIRTAARG